MNNEKYIVIELQTMPDGAVANIVTSHNTINAAESAYHSILAAAAISTLPVHSAVLLNNHGLLLEAYSFEHAD